MSKRENKRGFQFPWKRHLFAEEPSSQSRTALTGCLGGAGGGRWKAGSSIYCLGLPRGSESERAPLPLLLTSTLIAGPVDPGHISVVQGFLGRAKTYESKVWEDPEFAIDSTNIFDLFCARHWLGQPIRSW